MVLIHIGVIVHKVSVKWLAVNLSVMVDDSSQLQPLHTRDRGLMNSSRNVHSCVPVILCLCTMKLKL